MTGPEINGTLRRPWRYSLLTTISDAEGNYDPDVWNRLSEKVARMVVEAQAEAWAAGVKADNRGWVSSNPYTDALERIGGADARYADLPEGVRTSVQVAAEWRKRALKAGALAKRAWTAAMTVPDAWDQGWSAHERHVTACQRVLLGREAAEMDPDLRMTNPYRATEETS